MTRKKTRMYPDQRS